MKNCLKQRNKEIQQESIKVSLLRINSSKIQVSLFQSIVLLRQMIQSWNKLLQKQEVQTLESYTQSHTRQLKVSTQMNQLFVARNKLKEYSFQKFAEYLEKSKSHLTSIDYINLLQQSFNLYRKQFIDYLRIFHKYFHDIVFSQINCGNNKYTVLEEILKFRKAWALEELVKIDHRVVKDFNLYAVNCAIYNAAEFKDAKNGCQLIQILIEKVPDIIIDPVEDDRDNPLLQSICRQLYEISILLIKRDCYILPPLNCSSNQLHFLFKGRNAKKNHAKILEVAKLLINLKVDLYQINQHGRSAFDLCPVEMRQQLQKVYKLSLPVKSGNRANYSNNQTNSNKNQVNYHTSGNHAHSRLNHSNSNNSIKNQEKKTKNNNEKKNNDNNLSNNRNHNNNNGNGKLQKTHDSNYTHINQAVDNNSSNNLSTTSPTNSKNLYTLNIKGKVKSQFGGKQMIKQNNELLRINIQSNNLSLKDNLNQQQQGNNIPESNIVKILNFQELQNQASNVFQRHTIRKQDQFRNQKLEYERQEKAIREKKTKIIQSQQLKYYLMQEIVTLTDKIKKQNLEERQIFMALYEGIKKRLQTNIPQIEVQLFGSFATGLNLDISDIDIVISKNPAPKQQVSPGQILSILSKVNYQLLSMKEYFQQTKFLDKASVPIIKATCNITYKFKTVDISFRDDMHNGLESVEVNKKYLEMYPELNNLLLVLKKFIYQCNVFGPYSGGLSSYGLFLMILGYLQNESGNKTLNNNQMRPTQSYFSEINTQNISQNKEKYALNLKVAQLLIGFLKFYGFSMDYVTQMIVVTHPDDITPTSHLKGTTYNSQWQNEFPPQPKLIIIDPLDENNNVGKSTRRIKEIKMAFQLAFIAIHTNKRCKNKKTCESYKGIKSLKIQSVRFSEQRRPCCILQRMFQSTKSFDLHLY